jgi:hypothetical protein
MKRKKLTMEQAKINLAQLAGARQRELNARFLLLHLDQLSQASLEDLAALSEYVRKGTWKSLCGRDRRATSASISTIKSAMQERSVSGLPQT